MAQQVSFVSIAGLCVNTDNILFVSFEKEPPRAVLHFTTGVLNIYQEREPETYQALYDLMLYSPDIRMVADHIRAEYDQYQKVIAERDRVKHARETVQNARDRQAELSEDEHDEIFAMVRLISQILESGNIAFEPGEDGTMTIHVEE